MKTRHKRLAIAAGLLSAVGVMVALVLNAFQSNLVFFYSPSQVVAEEAPVGRTFRIGGMVEEGTVRREGLDVHFVVTDTARSVPVRYQGILPDLFQEGKGVVAQGQLHDGVFVAREVLAKHDENYMPPEAAEAVRRAKESRLSEQAQAALRGDGTAAAAAAAGYAGTSPSAAYSAGQQP
jgi:cytochrome c-type biogenesis protein CcmE